MISLTNDLIGQAHLMIELGALLCLFPIELFGQVARVNERLIKNELFASDLQDLIRLSQALLEYEQLAVSLKQSIYDLSCRLHTRIQQFALIAKSCGQHTKYLGI